MLIRTLPGGTVRSKISAAIVVGGIALVALAGCTSGSATPQHGSGGTTTTTSATSTAPQSEIANPLDVSKLSNSVCSGLTDAQVAPYMGAIASKTVQSTDNGPQCAYLPQKSGGPTASVTVMNLAAPTEDSLYATQAELPWRQKIPAISGFPAVNASSTFDPATGGECITLAAVNAKQTLRIDFSLTDSSDANFAKPCTVSQALMPDLIQNVQAGVS